MRMHAFPILGCILWAGAVSAQINLSSNNSVAVGNTGIRLSLGTRKHKYDDVFACDSSLIVG
jgi:hypothetical protein